MLWIIILIALLIAILIYSEYQAHDCIIGKASCNRVDLPKIKDDDYYQYIDKIRKMVKNNYEYVSWRQALIVGIIAGLVVLYFILNRFPTFFEWLVVTSLIFIVTYLSSNWIWSHFFFPNGNQIEKSLLELRDKIHKMDIYYNHYGKEDEYIDY